jgi:hypothetical protein
LGAECSTRRGGFPSSPQPWRAGRSKRLHHVSSQNPRAHYWGWVSASAISRSRSPFCGRTLDRDFRSSPWPAASSCQGAPKWRGRSPLCNPLLDYPLLETHLGCHRKRPPGALSAELPRRPVQEFLQGLPAPFRSAKAAWVRFGREEPAMRASRPRWLKSWMALRTYSKSRCIPSCWLFFSAGFRRESLQAVSGLGVGRKRLWSAEPS